MFSPKNFSAYILGFSIFLLILYTNAVGPDIGAPGYNCPGLMGRSPVRPTNAHMVRPADIDLVMAMGDSLTAGFNTDDVGNETTHEYRGLSFDGGADRGIDIHLTISNIIQAYNPNVFGGGHGIGGYAQFNCSNCGNLNMGISGMRANNLPTQVQNIINFLQAHPTLDNQNSWKLLNIFIGYNDLCNCGGGCYCENKTAFSADAYAGWIRTALMNLRAAVPKVIVNLLQMTHLETFADCGRGACGTCNNVSVAELTTLINAMQAAEKGLESSGDFDTTDDFTLVVQPFYTNNTLPLFPNGTINRGFWARDCYHYSSYGNALLASWYWKNLMEPVGDKTNNANLSIPTLPLACPDPMCPYIRTTKNSVNCQQFNGTCISDGNACTSGSNCCSGLCFNGKCS